MIAAARITRLRGLSGQGSTARLTRLRGSFMAPQVARLTRLRGSSSVAGLLTVNPGPARVVEPFSENAIAVAVTGQPDNVTLTQTAGPYVQLTKAPGERVWTYTAPAVEVGAVLVFHVTAERFDSTAVSVDVVHTVRPHTVWTVDGDQQWTPVTAAVAPLIETITPPVRKLTAFGTLATNAMSSSATWYPQLRPEIAAVMDEWSWRTLQPGGPGAALDGTAVAARLTKWQQYKDVGFTVKKVGLGLHFEPAWTFAAHPLGSATQDRIRFKATSDGTYAQADGGDTLDGVWSALVRTWYDDYLTRMAAVIPFSDIDVIRITAGGRSELLFPEQPAGRYWTGADHVQNGGTWLASGQTKAPTFGWNPSAWSTTQRRAYVEWYLQSLVNAAVWQMTRCRQLGFTGTFEITLPGRGMTVTAYESDIATGLPQSSVLSRGAAWHKVAELLPADPDIRLWATSVGQAGPTDANRIPQDADFTVPVTATAANSWAAFRWVRRLAHEHGYGIGGENPGSGQGADPTFYNDLTSAGLLARWLAEICGLGFGMDFEPADAADWAHADFLRTVPGLLAAYKAGITNSRSET